MQELKDNPLVAVAVKTQAAYPASPPYSPGEKFPEYRFGDIDARGNAAYALVREALHLCGLDKANYGTAAWNPLGEIVRPGETVVLKPNLVREFRESSPDPADCVVTHGAVIRAVADYVHIALNGRGRIVICDAPHNDADFAALRRITGLDELQASYRSRANFEIEVCDLRPECADKVDGVIVGHRALPGDPAEYAKVDLGRHSAFVEVQPLCHLLYGSEYDTRELVSHHVGGRHEYLISRTVLDADVVISLPKLKTHKKVALTVNLKNLVGINGNKNWLPHHREGTPRQGGDQFADDGLKRRIERRAVMSFKRLFPLLGPLRTWVAGPIKAAGKGVFGDTNKGTIRSGNWHGNDTTWRMVLDLNRILTYAPGGVSDFRFPISQSEIGNRQSAIGNPSRRFFSVVDGIVAGEGNGPLDPTPKPSGVVLAGFNPVAVDSACARLMGFDPRKIPMLKRALDAHELPLGTFGLDDIALRSNEAAYDCALSEIEGSCMAFEPHFGWRGHVEMAETASR